MLHIFIALACFLCLQIVAFINAYVTNLKGATVDAERLMDHAVTWLHHGEFSLVFDSQFYIQVIGVIFAVFGKSEFLVAQLNIFALLVACRYFHEICLFFAGRTSAFLTIPFMLWPSMIPRATTALREPLLILSIAMVCYFILLYARDGRMRNLMKCLGAFLLGALFHKAYAVAFVGFLAVIAILMPLIRQHRVSLMEIGGRVLIIASVISIGFGILSFQGTDTARGLKPLVAALTTDTEMIEQVVQAKTGRNFRTTYDYPISVDSPASFVASLPRNWIAYNFLPFPWQVANLYDLYAAAEGVFRFFGFVLFAGIYMRYPSLRRSVTAIFIIHMLLMVIWAAGTANYGTASRHHLTTNWIFLVYYWTFFVVRKDSFASFRFSRRVAQGGHDMAI